MALSSKTYFTLTFWLFFMGCQLRASYDEPQFYRASFLPFEPRLERAWLASFDGQVGGGETNKSYNKYGRHVPLLDLYGPYNMQLLGQGVPNQNLANPTNNAMAQLAKLPARDGFAHLSFNGNFELLEGHMYFTQNLCKGFFLQLHIPVRSLSIYNITYTDLSPTDNIFPNINTPEWQQFLQQFDAILKQYDLNRHDIEHNGVSDCPFLFGWTTNYQETQKLDYIDASVQAGILFPTGGLAHPRNIFDIPNGFDGHWGVPLVGDMSFGFYEWLTIGVHGDILFFLDRLKEIQIKTATGQSGLIYLASTPAKVEKGAVFTFNFYFKADHFFRGLSLFLGYSYNHKNPDNLVPLNPIFNYTIANSDAQLGSWDLNTFNFLVEYDFTHEDSRFGVRVGMFYNANLGGRKVFSTSLGGSTIGLDAIMSF